MCIFFFANFSKAVLGQPKAIQERWRLTPRQNQYGWSSFGGCLNPPSMPRTRKTKRIASSLPRSQFFSRREQPTWPLPTELSTYILYILVFSWTRTLQECPYSSVYLCQPLPWKPLFFFTARHECAPFSGKFSARWAGWWIRQVPLKACIGKSSTTCCMTALVVPVAMRPGVTTTTAHHPDVTQENTWQNSGIKRWSPQETPNIVKIKKLGRKS